MAQFKKGVSGNPKGRPKGTGQGTAAQRKAKAVLAAREERERKRLAKEADERALKLYAAKVALHEESVRKRIDYAVVALAKLHAEQDKLLLDFTEGKDVFGFAELDL